jgi:hypothetical protein
VKAKLEIAGGGVSKVRIPFVRPVTERKAVKDVLVSIIAIAINTPWTL